MSGNIRLNTTQSWIVPTSRRLGWLEDLLNAVSATSIIVLMLLAVIQVVGRKVFNAPIFGYIDWVEQIMVLFAFIGVAYCQREGGHVRMELVITNFRHRLLWLVEVIGIVIGLFIIGILIFTSFDHFLRAYEIGDSTINAELPVWPAKLVIPIAFASLWLRLFLQLFGYFRLLLNPGSEVLEVPVIMRVAEEAKKEIQDALGEESEVNP
ncbi:MAG: TRAP transporter small permease [Gammaproteobacteria bacterium]|jgi:TRAP-type mannitol/chloroaromatic compound transport system permease small subunit|nr:TRAP transporter small permease [Gammaproteobacteria bacterium]|tara:strand:- start:1594 stop:2220 length:627 start_codon:yes stop_codon:yes gene_type:complete